MSAPMYHEAPAAPAKGKAVSEPPASNNQIQPMIWKPCPRFQLYEVSDSGDVRRSANAPNQPLRRLNGVIDQDGYIRYGLRSNEGKKTSAAAHTLVIEAFIGPRPSPLHQVAHNNGSRLLNTPENLRWALYAENELDRASHGTRPCGERNPNAKITEADVRDIRASYRKIKEERGDVGELDRKYGLHRSQIISIAKGKSWKSVK